eukprot:TRINITY_DN33908_c0_g1_i1.p1 TRINITY_DN33908_c0_g1~~TRINITY_DN33908_c0_g1_i1.p1  ORF type:complete len:413 (+),score=76.48 TRINITY_DN33908_c0_g1_i1:66-1304(+)
MTKVMKSDIRCRTSSGEVIEILLGIWSAMILIIWLVVALDDVAPDPESSESGVTVLLVVEENSTAATTERATNAAVNAVAIVSGFVGITLLLLILYKYQCKKILLSWLLLASILVFAFLGWIIFDLLCASYQLPYDIITCCVILWNFAIVGVLSIFLCGHPFIKHGYLVITAVIVAWFLTRLPQWTTWMFLAILSVYDIYSVCSSSGFINNFFKTNGSKEEDEKTEEEMKQTDGSHKPREPTHLYIHGEHDSERVSSEGEFDEYSYHYGSDISDEEEEQGEVEEEESHEQSQPAPSQKRSDFYFSDQDPPDPDSLPGLIYDTKNHQLGLGDFVFYSLLIGRSLDYGFTPCIAAFQGVTVGVLITLTVVTVFDKPIPALPLPVLFGGASYAISLLATNEFVIHTLATHWNYLP